MKVRTLNIRKYKHDQHRMIKLIAADNNSLTPDIWTNTLCKR